MRYAWLASVGVMLASLQVAAEPLEMPSYQVPLSGRLPAPLAAGEPLRVAVRSENAAALSQNLAATTVRDVQVSGDWVSVTLGGRDTHRAPPSPAHTASSFVIDYELAPVQAVAEGLAWPQTGERTVLALEEHIAQTIVPSAYGRSFDIASEVASKKAGDCSEFAVLTTAVARAKGVAARTVLGSLVVTTGTEVTVFGHAWSEVFMDNQWQVADAAARPIPDANYFYMPVAIVANEGMGFLMGLLTTTMTMPVDARLETAPPAKVPAAN